MTRSGLLDVWPLTPLQAGTLFHALYDEQSPDFYTVQVEVTLEGRLDPEVLRAAAAAMLRRHPNLGAAFCTDGLREPVQVIPTDVRLPWTEIDLSGHDPARRERDLAQLRADDRAHRFNPAEPPLLRATLVRTAQEEHRLVFTVHHLVMDGWSTPVFLRELLASYGADDLPSVRPYRDYVAWLANQDRVAARRAWRDALAGLPGATIVAPAGGRPPAPPGRLVVELSEESTRGLTTGMRRGGWTLNTLVQAVWALALADRTGGRDVVFGATVSGRPPELPDSATMIGLFVNTVPVRVRLAESFVDVLGRLQEQQAGLLPHQHLGLSEIQRVAGLGELFDTTTAFENYPALPAMGAPAHGVRATDVDVVDATHYALTLIAVPGARLRLELGYRPELVDRAGTEAICAGLVRVLDAVADGPDLPTRRLLDLMHGPVPADGRVAG